MDLAFARMVIEEMVNAETLVYVAQSLVGVVIHKHTVSLIKVVSNLNIIEFY
jgi:hypothetical protein